MAILFHEYKKHPHEYKNDLQEYKKYLQEYKNDLKSIQPFSKGKITLF